MKLTRAKAVRCWLCRRAMAQYPNDTEPCRSCMNPQGPRNEVSA